MDQALALEIMLHGESVFLTGPAGSGKTYVLNEFIRQAKRGGRTVAVTATTGLAASHLGGTTLHAWSGLGVDDQLSPHYLQMLSKGRLETLQKADVLVIDEVSMLHDFRFDMLDVALRLARENDLPFGGLQVVLCGDFFQLPPVSRSDQRQGGFVVGSGAWQAVNPVICILQEQHRQDDSEFLEILNALRAGDVRRRHAEALLARVGATLSGEVTELYTTNADVDWINTTQLAAMPGEERRFTMESTGKSNYVMSLKRSCLAPEELALKEGALVMCIKNAPDRRYVNGSLGTVVGFEAGTGYPEVGLRSGRTVILSPETWELRDGDTKRASLTQIPLRLAWAITVHKSQGMTLDAARIDLRRAFVPGMGYVALSRVKRLDTLSLVGINAMALRISPEALVIDQTLRAKAADDVRRWEHLRAEAEARRQDSAETGVTASSGKGDWSVRLAKMRETHPNAFRPWQPADDEQLRSMHEARATLAAMTTALGRQPGSIRARLKKHFGEDVEIAG